MQTDNNAEQEITEEPDEEKSLEQDEKDMEIVEEENKRDTKIVMDEDYVKDILWSNLMSIFALLNDLGENHHWWRAEDADVDIVKSQIRQYTTDLFADTQVSELVEGFYCGGCDVPFFLQYSNEVRFSYELTEEDRLEIKALSPATPYIEVPSIWSFKLLFEDEEWKLDFWFKDVLLNGELGQNLDLSVEEVETLLLFRSVEAEAEFIEEFESSEAGGKAYLFLVKDEIGERYEGISSRTTSIVNDFPANSVSPELSQETVNITNLYYEHYEGLPFEQNLAEVISTYGDPVSILETSDEVILEYRDALYTISNSSGKVYQAEIIGETASSFYRNFDEVIEGYNPDPVYAEYAHEIISASAYGFQLVMDDGYAKKHVFYSENENGSPIRKIEITIDWLK